jgi:hypothetical protein
MNSSKWLAWLLVFQVCAIIIWDDIILQDPPGEDIFTKETVVERAQHAVDVCQAEYDEALVAIEVLISDFETDMETAVSMLGAMFTNEMRVAVREKPAQLLDHASPLVHDCAERRVHIHTGQRDAKRKHEQVEVLQQELMASLQRLEHEAPWAIPFRKKIVTLVLNGGVAGLSFLLFLASVYALYQLSADCPEGEACAYQAAVLGMFLSMALGGVAGE